MSDSPTCNDCKYRRFVKKGNECRRHAPTRIGVDVVRNEKISEKDNILLFRAIWPVVGINDWCGEREGRLTRDDNLDDNDND